MNKTKTQVMKSYFSSLISHFSFQKGFTLIELLVAIGIIGILSSFLLANFIGIRQRARDGVRKSDLRQIQSALELYRSDKGSYPPSGDSAGNFPTSCGTGVSFTDSTATTIYMQKVPCDPSTGSIYTYTVSGPSCTTSYCVTACLENGNDLQKDPTDVCVDASVSYTLQNP